MESSKHYVTAAVLARMLGVTRSALYAALKADRLSHPPVRATATSALSFHPDTKFAKSKVNRTTKAQRDRIAKLRTKGWSQTKIAEAVGVSQGTVGRVLRKMQSA